MSIFRGRWFKLSPRSVVGVPAGNLTGEYVSVIGELSINRLSLLPIFRDMLVLIKTSNFGQKFSIGVYILLSRLMHFEKSFSSVLIFLIF